MLPVNQVLNVERMLATGNYQIPFSKGVEDVWLAAYLFEKGYSEDEARSVWISIYETRYPAEKPDVYEYLFRKKWKKGQTTTLATQLPIVLYQAEIDAISHANMWYRAKQFALVLLAYAKSRGYSIIITNWAKKTPGTGDVIVVDETSRLTTSIRHYLTYGSRQREKDEWSECIKAGLLKYEYTFGSSTKKGGMAQSGWYKLLFLQKEGTVACRLDTLSDIPSVFPLLKRERVCVQCGAVFEEKARTQRELCDECYRKQRRTRKTESMQRSRAQK